MAAALRGVDGVRSATVNGAWDEAVVVREKGRASDAALLQAVIEEGFGARLLPVALADLAVERMECPGCPERVTGALQGVRGVKRVDVSLDKTHAKVVYDKRRADTTALVSALARAGFKATVAS